MPQRDIHFCLFILLLLHQNTTMPRQHFWGKNWRIPTQKEWEEVVEVYMGTDRDVSSRTLRWKKHTSSGKVILYFTDWF